MAYPSTAKVTYSYYDPLLSGHHDDEQYDRSDVEGLEDMADVLYKVELLAVLGSEMAIMHLSERLEPLLPLLSEIYPLHDAVTLCHILFSYDYFFATHRYLQGDTRLLARLFKTTDLNTK